MRNKDIIPKGYEGAEITMGGRVLYTIVGGVSLLSTIGSMPIDIIGMPINYLIKEKNRCLT